MINQNNIENIYCKLKNNDLISLKNEDDILKIIMYDIEFDINFSLSKKLIEQYKNLLFKETSNFIFQIIMSKKTNVLKYIFAHKNFNKNIKDYKKRNLLHYLSIIEENDDFLYSKYIDIKLLSKEEDLYKKKPLHYAISNNNYKLIYKILSVFTPNDINEINDLIILASKKFNIYEFEKIIKKFYSFGLKINDIVTYNDNDNKNALSESLRFNNFEIAYFLLKNGAIFYSNTNVAKLIIDNILNLKVLKMLLNNGINSNQKNENLDHPLIFLIMNKTISVELKIKIISLFYENRFNINVRDCFENNLLHYCVLYKEDQRIVDHIKYLKIIDNVNLDNVNSVDLLNRPDLKNKYIDRINEKYN